MISHLGNGRANGTNDDDVVVVLLKNRFLLGRRLRGHGELREGEMEQRNPEMLGFYSCELPGPTIAAFRRQLCWK
jgi:hypothetical protein